MVSLLSFSLIMVIKYLAEINTISKVYILGMMAKGYSSENQT